MTVSILRSWQWGLHARWKWKVCNPFVPIQLLSATGTENLSKRALVAQSTNQGKKKKPKKQTNTQKAFRWISSDVRQMSWQANELFQFKQSAKEKAPRASKCFCTGNWCTGRLCLFGRSRKTATACWSRTPSHSSLTFPLASGEEARFTGLNRPPPTQAGPTREHKKGRVWSWA